MKLIMMIMKHFMLTFSTNDDHHIGGYVDSAFARSPYNMKSTSVHVF